MNIWFWRAATLLILGTCFYIIIVALVQKLEEVYTQELVFFGDQFVFSLDMDAWSVWISGRISFLIQSYLSYLVD